MAIKIGERSEPKRCERSEHLYWPERPKERRPKTAAREGRRERAVAKRAKRTSGHAQDIKRRNAGGGARGATSESEGRTQGRSTQGSPRERRGHGQRRQKPRRRAKRSEARRSVKAEGPRAKRPLKGWEGRP